MKVITGDKLVFFDVDDTLVMWNTEEYKPEELVKLTSAQYSRECAPHKKHIKELKRLKKEGWYVVVWSLSGWDWAAAAVRALGLEPHVDLVMSKPERYYDGLYVDEWLLPSQRRYFPAD